MKIHQIFPEPVYFSNLERALTQEELKTVNEYKKETYNNLGNITSNDNYVLENKTLKNLKEDLRKMMVDYFEKIICVDNSISPYITQSWINYTETNQFHHRHFHTNSYISGIFLIEAKKESDKTTFYKPGQRIIELSAGQHTQHNEFNATSWEFPVQTGDVLLFPSFLHHGVDKKEGTNTRISLSFNVFFKGKIGVKKQLTELVLE